MRVCPNCGEQNPEKFRFCGYCGTKLVGLGAQESRKTITVVFSDLQGSTNLGERLDTETLREILKHYFAQMKAVVERHGGAVEKFIGDAIVAVFGLPRVHEDDALRAVRAAWEMKQAIIDVNRELEARWGVTLANRTGVNTGEVVAGDVVEGHRLVTGDTMNVAARLEQAAPPFEVLIGEPTYRLVQDAVVVEPMEPLELKGKAEPVAAYRLQGVRVAEAITRRMDTPLVGRTTDLAALERRLGRATREQRSHLVTVVGDAGVGKSRLIREFVTGTAGPLMSLHGRCLPYGEGITFWPVAEIVRQAAGVTSDHSPEDLRTKLSELVDEDVFRRVAAAVGLSMETFPLEETFWGVRKLVERLAADRPLVLVIDDIHWAESTLLDLLESLVDTISNAAVLVVCSSRHDLLQDRPRWGLDRPNAERLVLKPLSERESAEVVSHLVGDAPLPEDVRHRIATAAEGNPLFVEQLFSMLVEEGFLEMGADGGWRVTRDLTDLAIPASISALITARLDRLAVEDRSVIERGSVMGPRFYRDAIVALANEPLQPFIDQSLGSLTEKHLIRPDLSDLVNQQAFRFHHALIADAAYAALPKRIRTELHESYAAWLEDVAGTLLEFEEILGYHLEQAYRYRVALHVNDQGTRAVGDRATGLLSSAGRRALARGDVPAAVHLLERAASTADAAMPGRVSILADLGDALRELGQFRRASEVLDEAMARAAAMGELRLQKQAELYQLQTRFAAETDMSAEDALRKIEGAVPVLEEAGDESGLARAWRLIALLQGTSGRNAAAERAIVRAIDHARLSSDRLLETRNFSIYATSAVYGPTPVPAAIAKCEELLEQASGDRRADALIRRSLAQLRAFQGDFDQARKLYGQSREILEDLGNKVRAHTISIDSARVEMLAGRPDTAEAQLRRDYEALEAMGERYHCATVAALLAHALCIQGRYEEAEEFTRITEAMDEDDLESQSLWKRARGKVFARQGRFEQAEALVREALAMTDDADSPVLAANTHMDLAEVLEVAGRPDDGLEEVRKALRLYVRKGNIVSAERAAERVAALTPPAQPAVSA
jgi:predicted ATPase/class 3 adenylate cyclase